MTVHQKYEQVRQKAARRGTKTMSEIVRFQTNVPQELRLKYSEGLEVEGNFGPQVMFTLMDNTKAYTQPIVATKIKAAGIQPGELFTVCKREMGKGRIQWDVRRVEPSNVTAFPAPPTEQPRIAPSTAQQTAVALHQSHPSTTNGARKTELEALLEGSIANARLSADPTNGVPPANGSNGHSNGHQPPAAPPSNGHAPAPSSLMTGQSQFILQQLTAAVEAVHAVENYARLMGRVVTFSSEDIRAIAISCFIAQSKGGR